MIVIVLDFFTVYLFLFYLFNSIPIFDFCKRGVPYYSNQP